MSEQQIRVLEFWLDIYKKAFSIYENPCDAKIAADQARKDLLDTFDQL